MSTESKRDVFRVPTDGANVCEPMAMFMKPQSRPTRCSWTHNLRAETRISQFLTWTNSQEFVSINSNSSAKCSSTISRYSPHQILWNFVEIWLQPQNFNFEFYKFITIPKFQFWFPKALQPEVHPQKGVEALGPQAQKIAAGKQRHPSVRSLLQATIPILLVCFIWLIDN